MCPAFGVFLALSSTLLKPVLTAAGTLFFKHPVLTNMAIPQFSVKSVVTV